MFCYQYFTGLKRKQYKIYIGPILSARVNRNILDVLVKKYDVKLIEDTGSDIEEIIIS